MCGGYNHACALLRDGRVKCWGKNENGKLGIENPHQSIVGHGDAYMGDDPWAVTLGHDARHVAGMRKGANVRDVQRWFCQVLGQTYGPERDARDVPWLVLLLDG